MQHHLFFNNPEQLRILLPDLEEQSRELLAQPLYDEAFADSADTQHGRYNLPGDQLIRFANVLGIRYLLDGNPACADKLKAAMLQYAAYRKWIGSECLRKVPAWHSELNTTRFLYGMALGYDCIRDRLTPEESQFLASRCNELGIAPIVNDWLAPASRIHALDSMGHNWWAVCISAAGLAAVAFRDELPHARNVVQMVDDGLEAFFDYRGLALQNKGPNFDPAGAMYEGAIYLAYSMGELLTYRLARDRAFGPAGTRYDAFIPRCFTYLNHATYATEDDVVNAPIGDCNPHESMIKAFRLGAIFGYDTPQLRMYINRKGGPRDLWWALAGEKPDCPPEETVGYYPQVGMAFLRDSWEKNTRLLCVKCGDTWNHAHADAGSFILYDHGEDIFQDGGSCSYARDEYPLYYCQSQAHNVMLFNGQGQEVEDHYFGLRHRGQLESCEHGWLNYVLADASGPMCRYLKRHFRSFIMLNDALVMIDDLASYTPGTVSALFHHAGTAEIDGASATLHNTAAPYRIEALYPPRAQFEKRNGHRDHQPDEVQEYLALNVPIEARSLHPLPDGDPNSLSANRAVCMQKIITVIHKGDLQTSCTETEDVITITVGDTSIALNLTADTRNMHINSHAALLGWNTDAYLLAVHGQDYFMAAGSYLRRGDTVIRATLGKQNEFGRFPMESEGGHAV